MHSLRFLAAAAFTMTSLLSAPSQAQTCDPAAFTNTCTGDSLTYCSTANNTEANIDCATGFWSDGAPSSCGTYGCTGAGCTTPATCAGDADQRCLGLTGYLSTNPNPFAALCSEGNACVLGVTADGTSIEDKCVANTAATCALAETNKGCLGDVAAICLSFTAGDATLTDYVGTDCASFGGTCALDANNAPYCEMAEGAQCDPQLLLGCGAGFTCNPDTSICEVELGQEGQEGDDCSVAACASNLVCNANNICEAVACGNVTLEGECNGTELRFCSNDQLVVRDCATAYPENSATCGLVDATWGFDCLLDDNATCSYATANGDTVFTFCQEGSGCTLGDAGFTCVAGTGTCESPAQGQDFAQVCNGVDKVTVACRVNQPVAYSCPGSSTCSNGACNDIAVGDSCLDGTLNCAAGLVCDANVCIDPANPVDGGTPAPVDGGTTPVDPPVDGGTTVDPVADAGTEPVDPVADAGTEPVDPVADAGTEPVDPVADAGTDPVTPAEDAGTDPVTPAEDAGTGPVILDPGPSDDAGSLDDPAEEAPTECSHVQTHAERSGVSGLFALMLMGVALRRRRR